MWDRYIIMQMHGINNQTINNGVNETTTTQGCQNCSIEFIWMFWWVSHDAPPSNVLHSIQRYCRPKFCRRHEQHRTGM